MICAAWSFPVKQTALKFFAKNTQCLNTITSIVITCVYLISPGILIPGRELQHSDDFVDLGAHLLEGEVAVLQGLLHAVAA